MVDMKFHKPLNGKKIKWNITGNLPGNINENKILGMSEVKFSHKLLHDILNKMYKWAKEICKSEGTKHFVYDCKTN